MSEKEDPIVLGIDQKITALRSQIGYLERMRSDYLSVNGNGKTKGVPGPKKGFKRSPQNGDSSPEITVTPDTKEGSS